MEIFKKNIGPFFGGVIFAIGLGVSGMTEAKNIMAFLDVFGAWQGELLLVMGGAVLTYGVLYRLVLKTKKPLFDVEFRLPTRRDLDRRLIVGSALFGIGWGMTGLCPGPMVTSVVAMSWVIFVGIFGLVLGVLLSRFLFRI